MKTSCLALAGLILFATSNGRPASAQQPPASPENAADAGSAARVYDAARPEDDRLGPQALKDLNGHFPFIVPETLQAWEERADQLRRRVLIANGLWPMPERTELRAVIHGKSHRDGFTVEKVYFESLPGHFVTGLLFRPADAEGNPIAGRVPGVLCPHGHGGRLQEHSRKALLNLIVNGEERFEDSGRFPALARCAQLARMGCVSFIFDMLGYADSQQISYEVAHRYATRRPHMEGSDSWGFFSPQAEGRLQTIMGLQTWNALRSLDFLEQLPDVDPKRLAVTGNSGGGTQTILVGAIDPRPVVTFPNGMVSTSMQGGCTCENCSLLRIGTGNVELAALLAPRPQAMTSVDDWTIDMMTDGYPQLQQLYGLYGKPKNVYCRELHHLPHNYNYVTRAMMYQWFNQHLGLGLEEPIVEADFPALTPDETRVWDDQHPAPAGGEAHERELTAYWTKQSEAQLQQLLPEGAGSLQPLRDVVGAAWETIVHRSPPTADQLQRTKVDKQPRDGYILFKDILRLPEQGEEIPVLSLYPQDTEWTGEVVIWVDPAGKASLLNAEGQPVDEARRLLGDGVAVIAADLFGQGEFLADGQPITLQAVVKNPREYAGYTYTYNDTLLVKRVHDVLKLVGFATTDGDRKPQRLTVWGRSGAEPIAAAAAVAAGDAVDRLVLASARFRFADLNDYRHPDFVPGAAKYGDLPGLLALFAPRELEIADGDGALPELTARAYAVAAK